MKRLMLTIVAVGVMLNAGVSFAQDAPQMPEKVRNKLEKYVGRWNVGVGDSQIGEAVFRWAPGNHYIILDQLLDVGNGGITVTGLLSWDGLSENGTTMRGVSVAGHFIDRMKIVSETVAEGKGTGVQLGKKVSSQLRIEHQGPDRITLSRTEMIAGGEKQDDVSIVLTRVKNTSDEQELIRLQHEWSRATVKRDATSLDRLLDDDYMLTTSEGTFLTKAQMISQMQSDDFGITSMTIDSVKVQIYGNMAVVRGIVRFSGSDSNENLFTDTWVKRDGQWRCITTHESEMAKADSDAPKPDPAMAKLEGLVGDWTYEGEQADTAAAGLPFGPAGKFAGAATIQFDLGGFILETKWHDEGTLGSMSGTFMVGYDAKAGHYVESTFTGDGSRTVGTVTLNGRVWTSNSTMTTGEGKKILIRRVEKYSPDWSSYRLTAEASLDDGKTWKLWFKERGRKVKTATSNSKVKPTTKKDFKEYQ